MFHLREIIHSHESEIMDLKMDCMGCSFEDTSILPSLCQPGLGYQAFLFMSMIEMILRSKCSIADPCRRAKSAKSPDAPEFHDKEYDFIIVGAGPAGSVLAKRLSENPYHKVLLLEAGPEEPIAPSVPMFAFTALNTTVDWQFETIRQEQACLANNGICPWPRGKMICGTACMSGMMYTRGSPQIYDGWEADGNYGWNYDEVLHYFKKSENNTQPISHIEPEYHGFEGPMTVGNFPYSPVLAGRILSAAQEMGYAVRDVNGKYQTGFTTASVMVQNGVRASPSRMYLRPVIGRKNLRVLIEAYAVKIDFNRFGNRATGIQFRDKWGILRTVTARKEVILAGGVVGSPQLLLLSGIGPRKDLEKLRIKVIKDLDVGENVHHHFGVGCTVTMRGVTEEAFTSAALYEYVTRGSGPFASTGLTQVTAFLESTYAPENVPDLQLYLDGYSTRCSQYERETNTTTIALRPVYLLTKCRGYIKLRSANPYDKPIIQPNYLCDETEIEALLEAIRVLQRLMKTESLKKYVIEFDSEAHEACKTIRKDSDDYWRCLVRQYTLGENHHAGTCKMGPSDDPTAVVDPQLRVHGIPNLRVIDASIMPTPINCNTIAPVIMIAEKGADMIRNLWK